MSKAYKKIYIIGSDTELSASSYEKCSSDTSCTIFDYDKKPYTVQSILNELYDHVDSNTRLIIFAHGAIQESQHYIFLSDSHTETTKFIGKIFNRLGEAKRIELYSCFSGSISQEMFKHHNLEESVLVTNSKKDKITSAGAINFKLTFDDTHNNHSTPYHTFLEAIHINAAAFSQFITSDSTFKLDPSVDLLIDGSRTKEYLENVSTAFIEFTNNYTWNGSSIELQKPEITTEEATLFQSNLWNYLIKLHDESLLELLKSKNPGEISTINQIPEDTSSLLHSALFEKEIEIAELLIKHGATITEDMSLEYSIIQDNKEAVKFLLEHGMDPNEVNALGHPALFQPIAAGNRDIVELLLEHGADPNRPGVSGFTALQLASQENKLDMANLLIDHGADPNQLDNEGDSAFCRAQDEGQKDFVEMFLNNGAKQQYCSFVDNIMSILEFFTGEQKHYHDPDFT